MTETIKKIIQMRKSRDVLQSFIGDSLGLSNRQISHLETGRRELSMSSLLKILKCLHLKKPLNSAEWKELFVAVLTDML